MNMRAGGEKILADPVVFGGSVYFTSYMPAAGTDYCNQSGTAWLYTLNYTTGAGTGSFGSGSGTGSIMQQLSGSGIASSPTISMAMGPGGVIGLYVTTSTGGTQFVGQLPGPSSRTNMLYWRDQRIQ